MKKNNCPDIPLNTFLTCKKLKLTSNYVFFNTQTKAIYDEQNNFIGIGEMTKDNKLIITQSIYLKDKK